MQMQCVKHLSFVSLQFGRIHVTEQEAEQKVKKKSIEGQNPIKDNVLERNNKN